MPDKYYYLIASLPYLQFDSVPQITIKDFFRECEKDLSQKEYTFLIDSAASGDDPKNLKKDSSFFRAWLEFNREIQDSIFEFRTTKGARLFSAQKDDLKNALEEKNPFLREKAIEKIRWDFLEGEEYKYIFDFNRILLYFLKLRIQARLAGFDEKKGKEKFENACEVNYE
ncbi:hypothetical protein OMAG_001611 [Candidatus Omnitrophus magneticus]|uniref:DUF2764 family protein n=1 Tax=Candidatus Omnitrophus magneticus TaxID=1609969 RepID=A0A0F0CML0_9BACT|nr:hypothetical protein OMAG_001611 [Candidatus Omnitrophus magneticus]